MFPCIPLGLGLPQRGGGARGHEHRAAQATDDVSSKQTNQPSTANINMPINSTSYMELRHVKINELSVLDWLG